MEWNKREEMKHTIELDHDQCDSIAIASLKEAYRHNCKPDKIDCSDDVIEVDYHFLGAVDEVLEYFLNAEQKKVWEQEKKDMLK
jgi:hypothetical protein